MAFLRNPLAWHKRYVEKIYDAPRSPSAVVGSAGHKALEHFYLQVSERYANAGGTASSEALLRKCYSGADKATATALGLEYLRAVPDFELNFGKAATRAAQKAKRASMEREYLQAIGFYLARAPRHDVLGVEVAAVAAVEGFALPLKAVSDLVVVSREDPDAVDVIDHKFVDSFSSLGPAKPLFVIQALFNYFTVRDRFGKPVRRFIVYECKKRRNADGGAQLRRYVLDYAAHAESFEVFRRLVNDATAELARPRLFLPNPSDMFEGENSFDIYRLGLS